jgi:hypothetical protein
VGRRKTAKATAKQLNLEDYSLIVVVISGGCGGEEIKNIGGGGGVASW